MRMIDLGAGAGERGRISVQTRMLQALVAFVTIMTGAAVALAQAVTPDDPGVQERPGPVTEGLEAWWWIIVIAVVAAVVIWYAQRRTRGPR